MTGRRGDSYLWYQDREIGRGGYSTVYEGETPDHLLLALKVIRMPDASTVSRYSAAIHREIEVGRRLPRTGQSNLMPLWDDFMVDDDRLMLVMPRAQHSLAGQLAARGPLPESDAKALLLDVLAGMEELARHSIAHRDIKPLNTLWWNGQWVLADFGIARILEATTGTFTWAGQGTQLYWAPELWDGSSATVQTDLYAAGCTVLEALNGSPPFRRHGLGDAHRHDTAPVPELGDPAFERVLRLLLDKEPDGRPEDARQAREMLLPQGELSETQKRLQRLGALATSRAQAVQLAAKNADRLDRQRRSAVARFSVIWDQLAMLARGALADARPDRQADSWFLTAADARLHVTIRATSDPQVAALIGEVVVGHMDRQDIGLLPVANVIARVIDERIEWALATFSANAISESAPNLPMRSDGRGWGIRLNDAERTIAATVRPNSGFHISPVLSETQPLTADALFALFVTEAEGMSPDHPAAPPPI